MPARLLGADSSKKVPAQYVVVFKAGDDAAAKRDSTVTSLASKSEKEFKVLHKYDIGTMIGFAAVLSHDVLQTLLNSDDVDYIEFDQEISIA